MLRFEVFGSVCHDSHLGLVDLLEKTKDPIRGRGDNHRGKMRHTMTVGGVVIDGVTALIIAINIQMT